MTYRKCEICNLKSGRKNGTKRFFMARFPLDEVRCKEWVKMTGKEDLAYIPVEKLNQLKFVCGKHFREKDFKKKKTQLRNTAIPLIRLTAKPLSDDRLIGFPYQLFRKQRAPQERVSSTCSAPTDTLEVDEHTPRVSQEDVSSTSSAPTHTENEKLLANLEEIYNECDIPSVEHVVEVTMRSLKELSGHTK